MTALSTSDLVTYSVTTGDVLAVLRTIADESFQCVVTSPPYWGLRDYGSPGQIGLEPTPDEYVAKLVAVFREVRRVLTDDGTFWLNLGDTYCNSDKWGGGGANTGKHTREPDGEPASWKAVRRRWANLDDVKPKDLVGIPWAVAFALRSDGWYLRRDIIWSKTAPMPESVRDRPTTAHEYLFLLAKSPNYFYDCDAIAERAIYGGDELGIMRGEKVRAESMGREPSGNERAAVQRRESKKRGEFNGKTEAMAVAGRNAFRAIKDTRNKRSVWTLGPEPFRGAHFAVMPSALVEPCILAGSRVGDTVLDPFSGAGTTGVVALKHGRHYRGIELNPEYTAMSLRRLAKVAPMFTAEITA